MERTISLQHFNQNPAEAQQAAENGPVIVTERGLPAFVLLRYEDYRRLSGGQNGLILDLLRQEGSEADFSFEPQPIGNIAQPAAFD